MKLGKKVLSAALSASMVASLALGGTITANAMDNSDITIGVSIWS